jgi:hypothetical protein
MAHRIKCDGEIFLIPAGHLRLVLSDLSPYTTEKGEVNYEALKSAIKQERIKDFPPSSHADEMGFIDFDQMEQNRSRKPVVVGYYKHYLDRRTKLLVD